MRDRDFSRGLLFLRLNALQCPFIGRGIMLWRSITFVDVQYMTGSWFIDGLRVDADEIERLVARAERAQK